MSIPSGWGLAQTMDICLLQRSVRARMNQDALPTLPKQTIQTRLRNQIGPRLALPIEQIAATPHWGNPIFSPTD